MPETATHDLWEIAKTALYLLVYLLIAFLGIKISHGSIKEFAKGIGSELRSFAKLDPSTRTLNMLFGILMFLFIVVVLTVQEVAEVQHREVFVPSAIVALVGMFWLAIFFSLSVAFCAKAQK